MKFFLKFLGLIKAVWFYFVISALIGFILEFIFESQIDSVFRLFYPSFKVTYDPRIDFNNPAFFIHIAVIRAVTVFFAVLFFAFFLSKFVFKKNQSKRL